MASDCFNLDDGLPKGVILTGLRSCVKLYLLSSNHLPKGTTSSETLTQSCHFQGHEQGRFVVATTNLTRDKVLSGLLLFISREAHRTQSQLQTTRFQYPTYPPLHHQPRQHFPNQTPIKTYTKEINGFVFEISNFFYISLFL